MKTESEFIPDLNKELSKDELGQFGEYLRSPYFKVPKRIYKLYKLIETGSEMQDNFTMTKNMIIREFYGEDSPKVKTSLRKLISDYRKYLNAFKSQKIFDKDYLTIQKCELQWYREKKQFKEYFRQTEKIIGYLNEKTVKDEEYYYNMTDIYNRLYSFTDSKLENPETSLSHDINMYLDLYFVSMKIFLFQRFYSLEYVYNTSLTADKTFQESLYEFIRNKSVDLKQNHPEIFLRYIALKLDMEGFNEELFNTYIDTLENVSKYIKINENGFYITLLHVCSKIINNNQMNLDEKVIEIAEKMEEKDIFKTHGIGYIDLKVIIESAIGKRDFQWGINFMDHIKNNIKHEDSSNVYNLLKGKLLFFTGSYQQSRILLNRINIEDYFFYAESKLIEMRISLTESNTDAVLSLSDAVLKFLKAHKEIGTHYISAYKIFITYCRNIAAAISKNISSKDLKIELNRLRDELVLLEYPCYAHGWLIDLLNSKLKQ